MSPSAADGNASTEPVVEAEPAPEGWPVNRRFLLIIIVLALITRMIWVLWLHPPSGYVFSDMKKYVGRAQDLVEHGFHPDRRLAWQAWGTHYLLAIPLKLFGREALWAGAVLWGALGAMAVPAGYLLSCRVSSRAWMPYVVGVALLLWWPNISNSGYFLSEAPFLCFQLWSTYLLVVVLRSGRHAFLAGVLSALAFAIRPQSALLFVLVFVTWAVNHRRVRHVGGRQLSFIALPLLLMLSFSMWRFHAHTGYWAGVAENANMNLTAGRCHNIVTQAFKSERRKRQSERRKNTRDGRRVSLPGFRVLAKSVRGNHPLALRPAMRSETIRIVGYIGEPEVHKEVRAECYRRTGTVGQARYSLVNMSLLWFVGRQWPEQSRSAKYLRPPAEVFKYIFQWVFWLPSLVGVAAALAWIRRRPGLTFCAWQLVTSMVVAAVFFGTIRLRTPYDPYAMILALEGWVLAVVAVAWIRRKIKGERGVVPPAPADSSVDKLGETTGNVDSSGAP